MYQQCRQLGVHPVFKLFYSNQRENAEFSHLIVLVYQQTSVSTVSTIGGSTKHAMHLMLCLSTLLTLVFAFFALSSIVQHQYRISQQLGSSGIPNVLLKSEREKYGRQKASIIQTSVSTVSTIGGSSSIQIVLLKSERKCRVFTPHSTSVSTD